MPYRTDVGWYTPHVLLVNVPFCTAGSTASFTDLQIVAVLGAVPQLGGTNGDESLGSMVRFPPCGCAVTQAASPGRGYPPSPWPRADRDVTAIGR